MPARPRRRRRPGPARCARRDAAGGHVSYRHVEGGIAPFSLETYERARGMHTQRERHVTEEGMKFDFVLYEPA